MSKKSRICLLFAILIVFELFFSCAKSGYVQKWQFEYTKNDISSIFIINYDDRFSYETIKLLNDIEKETIWNFLENIQVASLHERRSPRRLPRTPRMFRLLPLLPRPQRRWWPRRLTRLSAQTSSSVSWSKQHHSLIDLPETGSVSCGKKYPPVGWDSTITSKLNRNKWLIQ